jgi:hypothetical protein
MDRSTEGAAQDSVLEFELFSAESVVNNGKGLFVEHSNIGIRVYCLQAILGNLL